MTLRVVIGFGDASIPANIPPDQPTITAGTPASTGVTLYGSAFSDDDPGDTHATSYWEVNSDPTFYADAEAVSGYTSTFLTQWNATGLDPETLYYARVFYGDSSGGFSPWSSTISFTTAATPVVTGELVDVQVTRLENGTGSGLCSTGIPLPPGLFFVGDEAKVKAVIGGTEQAVYVEALTGRHSDNSVRSILVQFNIDCDYGSPILGTIEVGEGVTRGTVDISKTAISAYEPTIAMTATDVNYLLSCDLILPTIAVADIPATPASIAWHESHFVTYGDLHWNEYGPGDKNAGSNECSHFNSNYYDRALIWYTQWLRTGTVEYFRRGCIQAGYWSDAVREQINLDIYYVPSDFNQAVEGLDLLYHLTGYSDCKEIAAHIARRNENLYGPYQDLDPNPSWIECRNFARVNQSCLVAWRLGDTSRDWAALLRGYLNDVLPHQQSDGSYSGIMAAYSYETAPFTIGLLYDAWIKYYHWFEADTRILPEVIKFCDWCWANMWVAGDEAFKYQESSTGGSPDLNQLLSNVYAWAYYKTGTTTYLTQADACFAGGVAGGVLWMPLYTFYHKQFNQAFRQYPQYLYYRQGA